MIDDSMAGLPIRLAILAAIRTVTSSVSVNDAPRSQDESQPRNESPGEGAHRTSSSMTFSMARLRFGHSFF